MKHFNHWQKILLSSALILPFLFACTKVFTGELSFWYDNARDFLSAWGNLSDPTLIGPTSGIPGIFYGPYWIWFLSIPLIFSKDPRFVAFIVGVVPYFIVFPLLLYQFRKIVSFPTLCIVWILFSTSFGLTYAHNLWNPRIAPVFTLFLIFLLLKFSTQTFSPLKRFLILLLAGFVGGVIINVHISFGIGVLLGSILFLLLNTNLFQNTKLSKKLITTFQTLTAFLFGVLVAFVPFFLFELRHNFSQTTTALQALSKFGDVVTLKGLSKIEIVFEFIKSIKMLFHIPLTPSWNLPIIITITVLCYFGYVAYKHNTITPERKKLLLLLFSLFITIVALYLTARNPIWDYHFIGVEIIFLFFFALFIDPFSLLKKFLYGWCIFILSQTSFFFIHEAQLAPFTVSNLRTKVYITDIIAKDAGMRDYTVFSYQPSIYQYEYTYLFKWRYNKDIPYDPGQISANNATIYLILPKKELSNEALLTNFVSYRTPENSYVTEETWKIADGSSIIKRIRME